MDPYSSGALYAPAFREAGVPLVALVTAPKPPDVCAASYRPEDPRTRCQPRRPTMRDPTMQVSRRALGRRAKKLGLTIAKG